MSAGTIVFMVIAGILIALILYAVIAYNSLVGLRNQLRNAWSQIEVQLKRRHDLIPNLVETAKGYMSHERQTFEAVTQARSLIRTSFLCRGVYLAVSCMSRRFGPQDIGDG